MGRLVKVAVTGAAGQIGYAILSRLITGEIFGPDTKVVLHLLEVTSAISRLEGVVLELTDCSFPLLHRVIVTDNPKDAFDGVNWALLIGAKPRSKGMERSDLIQANGPIFVAQAKALNAYAADDVRIVVVGNPVNTNCLIAMSNAKNIPDNQFAALTRLDENRAAAQLAQKAGVAVSKVSNMAVWGNHSPLLYPDAENAKIAGEPAFDVIKDHEWLRGEFLSTIQQRGAEVIAARGFSSALSAANATLDHVKSFESKTPEGDWFSAAVPADGSYGIEEGIVFSMPLRSDGEGGYEVVQGLKLSSFAQEEIGKNIDELRREREIVAHLLD